VTSRAATTAHVLAAGDGVVQSDGAVVARPHRCLHRVYAGDARVTVEGARRGVLALRRRSRRTTWLRRCAR